MKDMLLLVLWNPVFGAFRWACNFQAQAAFQTFKDLTAAVKAASSNGADALWPRFAIESGENGEGVKIWGPFRSGYILNGFQKGYPKKWRAFIFSWNMLVGTEENMFLFLGWDFGLKKRHGKPFGMAGSIQTPVTRKDHFQLQKVQDRIY